jgi:hypothetical protein
MAIAGFFEREASMPVMRFGFDVPVLRYRSRHSDRRTTTGSIGAEDLDGDGFVGPESFTFVACKHPIAREHNECGKYFRKLVESLDGHHRVALQENNPFRNNR